MFYSHDILQKRGGKFGIVWVAATRQSELSRREYMSVRVRKTCEDIIDYVFLRVPGRTKEGARPRFSLYLSAQLMYGTIKVFSKQSKYLYDDTARLMCNLKISTLVTPSQEIDLKFDPTKQNLPELVGRADPISADYDHDFGTWGLLSEQSISIFEQEMLREVKLSPSLRLELSPSIVQSHAEMTAEALQAPHTVSSPEDIKLREELSSVNEQVQIPGEKELPGFDGREIDLVADHEMKEIPITLADLVSPRKSRSRSTSSVSDVVPMTEEPGVTLPPIQETPPKKPPSDEERFATPSKVPKTPGVTPIQPEESRPKRRRVRPSLQMELVPVTPSPQRRRRKRRLQFIDVETQISKKQLKKHMVTGKDTCIPYVLPATCPSTAEELFDRPGLKERQEIERDVAMLHAEKEAVVLPPSPPLPTVQSDSDKSSGSRRSQRLSKKQLDTSKDREMSLEVEAPEVARGDSVLSLERSRLKDVSIEMEQSRLKETSLEMEHSRQSLEQSRERLMDESIGSAPRSRRGSEQISSEEEAIQLELVPEHLGVSGVQSLETVLEEQEVPAPRADLIPSPPSITNYQGEMMRHVDMKTATKTWTRFHTICSTHNTYKSYASKMFTALLDLCAAQIVLTRQKEAFADIYIRRGPQW